MKHLKHFFASLMILLLFVSFVTPAVLDNSFVLVAEAHSGRTDSNGGHHDNKNVSGLGSYHYHCGGHPAHLHPNGKCPYASSGSSSTKVKLNKTSATLTEGKTLQLKLNGTSSKANWTSNQKSVATVNSKGLVTAKKKGSAVITAQVGSKNYSCKLTVKALSLNKTKVSLTPGQNTVLKLDTSKKIKWSSSNKKVASVTSKGKVTAKQAGKATITASVGKKKYTCVVTVQENTSVWKDKIVIKTMNYNPEGNELCFKITNNTNETITVYKELRAYDDLDQYNGSMTLPSGKTVKIKPRQTKEVTFSDASLSGELIYYTQRFEFKMKVGSKKISCYAEYSYNNKTPYKFTFK